MELPCKAVGAATHRPSLAFDIKVFFYYRYTREEMFAIVSDVGKYENFLPFCFRSIITSRGTSNLRAVLTVGVPPIRDNYVSEVWLRKPFYVHGVAKDGRFCDLLETIWSCSNGPINMKNCCITSFSISFTWRYAWYSLLMNNFMNIISMQTQRGFLDEAFRRYGNPSLKPQKIQSIA